MQTRVGPALEQTSVGGRCRVTVYLDDEDIATLDELKAYFRRAHRRRLDRSQLMRDAIRSYRERHLRLVKPGQEGQE